MNGDETDIEEVLALLALPGEAPWALNVDDGLLVLGEAFATILGQAGQPRRIRLRDFDRLLVSDDAKRVQAAREGLLAAGNSYAIGYRILDRSGRIRWLDDRAKIHRRKHDGRPAMIVGSARDVTDETERVRGLRRSAEDFDDLARNIPGAIFRYVVRPDGTDAVEYMSPGCLDLWEIAPRQVMDDATALWRMIVPEDLPAMQASVRQSAETLTPWLHNWRITTPSGVSKWLRGSGQPQRLEDGSVRWNSLILDVSAEKHREIEAGKARSAALEADRAKSAFLAGLEEQRRRLQFVIDNLPIVLLAMDRDGVFTLSEGKGLEAINRKPGEVVGLSAFEMYRDQPAAQARIRRAISGEAFTTEFELAGRTMLGCYTPLRDDAGALQGCLGFMMDITERKEAESALQESRQALFQSQKLEAVGKLSGGVAHDFNNLLTVILGSLELLAEDMTEGSPQRVLAERAMRAGERGASLTRSLLAFARQQRLSPSAVDVNELVEEMADLLRRTLPATIALRIVTHGSLWRCEADAAQLQNALVNLVINARDAMPAGGTITIETANADLDDAYAAAQAEVVAGSYVALTVSDTGTGMSPEVMAKAFDPFFTTKETGKGTGLGLSMVFGFAKQSGGHVRIYSEEGTGTSVKLYLPRLRPNAAVEVSPHESAAVPGHGNRILVVEDDPDLLAMVFTLLRSLGYEVESAHDGKGALALLEHQPAIDLLLTDVVLAGGLTGIDVAERALALRPYLPIVFMSGYTEAAVSHEGGLPARFRVLEKPFTKAQLSRAIARALAGEAPARPEGASFEI